LALFFVYAPHRQPQKAPSLTNHPHAHPLVLCRFGLDPTAVRLGWHVSHTTAAGPRGTTQLFYEVQVHAAAAPTTAPPVWASSKTASADMQLVVGPSALKDGTAYTWKVRVWLSNDPTTPTAWGCGTGGTPAPFETAPTAAVFPGAASWIGGGGQLRLKNGLKLPAGTVAKARAYVTGVGAFYFYINGERVGVNVMDPPQTVYSKTVLYTTFDVTSLLLVGAVNDVGAIIGNYKWGHGARFRLCVTGESARGVLLGFTMLLGLKVGHAWDPTIASRASIRLPLSSCEYHRKTEGTPINGAT
jgi:hypothetical protein